MNWMAIAAAAPGIESARGARKSDRMDFILPEHGQLAMLASGVSHLSPFG
jgi:hypothetical protein